VSEQAGSLKQVVVRWTLFVIAALALGPIAGVLTASLRSSGGGEHATLLVSSTPGRGVLLGALVLLVAAAAGALTARLTRPRDGLTVAGLVLVWAAARTGEVDVMLRAAGEPGLLWRLCVEGLLVGVGGVLVAAVVYAAGRPEEQAPDAEKRGAAVVLVNAVSRSVRGQWLVRALPVALVAAVVVAWLVAIQPLKGQVIAAAFFGALAAAAVARLMDQRTPAQSLFVVIALLAAAGPASAFYFGGGDGPVVDAYAHDLVPLARITPLDWVAGALLGAPWGLSWVSSASEKQP